MVEIGRDPSKVLTAFTKEHDANRQTAILMKASFLMQRLSYPTETVVSNKITKNRIVISF